MNTKRKVEAFSAELARWEIMTGPTHTGVWTQMLQEAGVTILALFTSMGTLVCCALPILLVSIAGLGSVVASLTSNFPVLITLSQYKVWVFAVSALMLVMTAWLLWRPGRACPADPALARWCNTFQIWERRVFVVSAGIWNVGFFAAFLALPLRIALGI